MEAQLLYFTRQYGSKWNFKAVFISKTHLDSIPPGIPSDEPNLINLVDVIGKLCADNGKLAGWYRKKPFFPEEFCPCFLIGFAMILGNYICLTYRLTRIGGLAIMPRSSLRAPYKRIAATRLF